MHPGLRASKSPEGPGVAEPATGEEPAGHGDRRGAGQILARILRQREATLAIFLLVFCIALSFASPAFFTVGNIDAVLLGLSVEGIIAVGMTVLMAAGQFDLSVGSVLALGGITGGLFVLDGLPAWLSMVLAVLVCAAVGLINGMLVAKFKINCFIETLGALYVVQGVVLLAGGGFGVSNLPSSFTAVGQTTVRTVQIPIFIMLALAVVGDFLMRRGRIPRYAYYIGGNERAARLTGIPVERVQLVAFVLTSALAGFAGVLEAARFGSASVTVGANTPLDVIAAVVIGGAALSGGTGTVLGSMLGVLLLQLILNALNLLGVSTSWQPVATGAVLILAVGADAFTGRLRARNLWARIRRLRAA